MRQEVGKVGIDLFAIYHEIVLSNSFRGVCKMNPAQRIIKNIAATAFLVPILAYSMDSGPLNPMQQYEQMWNEVKNDLETNSFFVQSVLKDTDALIHFIWQAVEAGTNLSGLDNSETWEHAPIATLGQLKNLIELQDVIRARIGDKFCFGVKRVEMAFGGKRLTSKKVSFISTCLPLVETLKLHSCRSNVTDVVSMVLASRNLKHLHLNVLKLGDGWDQVIHALPESLEELDLGRIDYRGEQAKGFQRLYNLKKLCIFLCELGGGWSQLIHYLPESLEELNLVRTDYRGQQAENFHRLRNLKKLCIFLCELGGGWGQVIPSLPESLEELDLGHTDYEGQRGECFQCLSRLKSLNLRACRLGDKWKQIMHALPESLEALNLSSDYEGQQAENFHRLCNLKKLSFSHCNLGDGWNMIIPVLPESLEELDLFNTDYAGQQAEGFQRLRNLKHLNLNFCRLGDGWDMIIPVLPESLEFLSLWQTDCPRQLQDIYEAGGLKACKAEVKKRMKRSFCNII